MRSRHVQAACAALWLAAGAAGAQPAADAELKHWLKARMADFLELKDDLPVDAPLLAAARQIAQDRLADIDSLHERWIADERQASRGNDAGIHLRLLARQANTVALLQMGPGDRDDDAMLRRALQSPPWCYAISGQRGFFFWRVLMIQALPESDRGAALQQAAQQLRNWGAEAAIPPEPPADRPTLQQALDAIKSGDASRPGAALPPLLAMHALAETPIARAAPDLRCAAWRWWVQVNPGDDAALAAYRYGTMLHADEMLSGYAPPAKPTDVYSTVARRFEAEGTVGMRWRRDVGGKAVDITVTQRKIAVPGIRGVRPVVFEPVLENASIERVRQLPVQPGAPGTVTGVEVNWKLQ